MDSLDTELLQVAAVLVEERVLRRVIKKHRELPGIGLQVPHARCYTLPRGELAELVDADELHVDPADLPAQVVLISGSRAALAAGDRGELSSAWRAIFHARIHQAFDQLIARGALTPAVIRERIHRIGQIEFDEIRWVLGKEDLLLPPIDDTSRYVEFVALYLELQQFTATAVGRTFPTLDLARVDATIALDLDAAALLAASRPARAPDRPVADPPAPLVDPLDLPPLTVDAGARTGASRARLQGNRARAAILSLRAGDREMAGKDLDELGARLARAVGSAAIGADWTQALLPLAEAAARQRVLRFTVEARLLHDLQTACVVADRETKIVDVAGWALALGRQRIVRALPATREVRVAKHLHVAARKLAACTLPSAADQERLAATVHDIVERGDISVRAALRPKLEAALDEVALQPRNLPERVAQKKLIDELLDHAVAGGRLSIGHLRDAISHNDLKIPDLEIAQLRTGDELLRCDHALSRSLDGVYRRGESYLRFFQKVSSILFATALGRLLTLYLILPWVISYTAFKGAQEMVDLGAKFLHQEAPELAHQGPIAVGAALVFLLLHAPPFRGAVMVALRVVGRALRLVLFDLPRALLRRPLVQLLLGSRFVRWVVKPGLPAAIVLVIDHDWLRWPLAAAVFALLAIALNSQVGRKAQEMIADGIVRSSRQLTTRIVPALIRWTLDLFTQLMQLLDRGLYRVDEWLRFRTGQSRLTLIAKGALSTVWSAVAYLLRLYVNLFIEPVLNPIKHFPVVTVAAKLMLPFFPVLEDAISGPAQQVLGTALGASFAWFTVVVAFPGIAGFLVWELKENWKLYRNTRGKTLGEVSFGHHGETMVSFLKPGLHSGTIPKRFTKLRRAAWKADEHGVSKHKEELHHVEHAIHNFADRELVSMLNEAAAFRLADVAVTGVTIGSNRVQIELTCAGVSPEPARITFEHQSGWTVASIPERGWIDTLHDDQRRILEIALAGFYKRSGVDVVREQLEQVLAGDDPPPPYDLADEGLIVWPNRGYQTEAVYDLRAPYPTPKLRGEPWTGELPPLAGYHALYGRERVTWSAWTAVWEQLARGEEPAPIIAGPSLLRRPPRRATAIAV
jgi:hypothetical protein